MKICLKLCKRKGAASKEERHKQIKNWEKVVYVNVNECIH